MRSLPGKRGEFYPFLRGLAIGIGAISNSSAWVLTAVPVIAIISAMRESKGVGDDPELLAAARVGKLPARNVPLRGGQSVAVLGKKVLLQILAMSEAQRLGITVGEEEISATTLDFRRTFGLAGDSDFQLWLTDESLTPQRFHEFMRRFAVVARMESHCAADIARELPDMLRIDAARERTLPR